ncbi:hypothetical protein ABVT39_002742 [Epinephelus coioides]
MPSRGAGVTSSVRDNDPAAEEEAAWSRDVNTAAWKEELEDGTRALTARKSPFVGFLCLRVLLRLHDAVDLLRILIVDGGRRHQEQQGEYNHKQRSLLHT